MTKTRRLVSLTAVLLLAPAATLSAQQDPVTVAESTQFKATSRHADVMAFIHDLQRQHSSRLRVETLCTSAEGRQVPLLIIGDPVPSSPADLRFDQRIVVYFQANIHAGEVEGKEAMLMLARDLLQHKTPDYLDRLVVLLAPIFNADGNEKISPENRRNQTGPIQGVGIRYNGQNLDLNRDGMKLESPEVAGLVENVLLRWDPVLFLDSHTHNGSYHQEPVTWTWGLNPNGDPALLDYMATRVWPSVDRIMRQTYHTPTIPHGDFMDPRHPEQGWIPLEPLPRYLSNYVGLRNRLSVLNEQYPYVDFETRVRGAYDLFLSFLAFTHDNRDDIVRLLTEVDQRTMARGAGPTERDTFVVDYKQEPVGDPLTILGYEMEVATEPGGRPRVHPTETKRTYERVPYLAKYTATRSVPFPYGYVIPVADQTVVAKLRQHGISVERLVEPVTLTVQSFTVQDLTASPQLNQGHYTNTVKGRYNEVRKEFPAGTYYVRTAQALAPVAAVLLEPESNDGLLVWNFFDRYLATQFGGGSVEYPVYKLLRPASLVSEVVR